MPTIISGDGTITGLTSTGISAAQTVTSVPSSALPAGTVKQVLFTSITSNTSTTSATFATIGLSLSITPSSTSSRILVIANVRTAPAAANQTAKIAIFRNSTNITSVDGYTQYGVASLYAISPIQTVDSPSSTSSITYSVQMASTGGTVNTSFDGQPATLIVMEIAG